MSLSKWLEKMEVFMSQQQKETSKASGQSTISHLQDSELPCTPQSSAFDMDKTFIEGMAECLTLMKKRAQAELQKAEIDKDLASTHLATARNAMLPHRIYGGNLKHDGCEWVMQFGQDEDGSPYLVGRGSNPQAALTDFDYKWLGMEPGK